MPGQPGEMVSSSIFSKTEKISFFREIFKYFLSHTPFLAVQYLHANALSILAYCNTCFFDILNGEIAWSTGRCWRARINGRSWTQRISRMAFLLIFHFRNTGFAIGGLFANIIFGWKNFQHLFFIFWHHWFFLSNNSFWWCIGLNVVFIKEFNSPFTYHQYQCKAFYWTFYNEIHTLTSASTQPHWFS